MITITHIRLYRSIPVQGAKPEQVLIFETKMNATVSDQRLKLWEKRMYALYSVVVDMIYKE